MSVNSDMAPLHKVSVMELAYKVPIRKPIAIAHHYVTIQTVPCVDLSPLPTDGVVN